MENNVVEFPTQETKTKTVTQPEKGKGVTTINELRKKVKEIDIYSITPDGSEGEYGGPIFNKDRETGELTLNERMFNPYFNKKTDKMEYRLALRKGRESRYYRHRKYPDGLNSQDNDCIRFSGKGGYYGAGLQQDFSECMIFTDSLRGTIKYVQYSLDESNNRFFKNFLRSTVDPSIPNNWDEVHKTKTFELVVSTINYEKISAEGRTESEAIENAKKSDETLQWMSGRFNGKKEILREREYHHFDFRTREEILAERNAKDA